MAERCASLRTVGGRVLAGLQRCRRGAQRHSPSSPTHTAHCRPQLPLLPLQMGTGETTNHRGKPTVFLRLPRTSCQPFAQPSTQGAGCSKPCGQGRRGCGCEPVRFAHWGHGDWPPCSDTGPLGPVRPQPLCSLSGEGVTGAALWAMDMVVPTCRCPGNDREAEGQRLRPPEPGHGGCHGGFSDGSAT